MFRGILLLAALGILAVVFFPVQARSEILNDDEYGWLEVVDLGVIEEAAGMFPPSSLRFNVGRSGPLSPGDEIVIYYHTWNDYYASLIDYSPDRKVKPLLVNEHTTILDQLDRSWAGTVGDAIGTEYILLLVTTQPLTDEELESMALAPNEIETGDKVFYAAVSDFNVVAGGRDPGVIQDWAEANRGYQGNVQMIELSDFATYIEYPLNRYPYNPWPYMYLYPYARFNPTAYVQRYGPFSKTWYVFPTMQKIECNFWDYAYTGWIDNGIMVIPPGGYWQGTFRADDPYSSYWLRVLPYLIRENRSYYSLRMEINGNLVEPTFDIRGAIGWGQYWTSDPFAYYSIDRFLRTGDNTIRLYWPESESEDLQLQMVDVVPTDVVTQEIDEAQQAAEEEDQTESGE
jgi:hypothetical protein